MTRPLCAALLAPLLATLPLPACAPDAGLDAGEDEPQIAAESEALREGCWNFNRGALGRGLRYLKFTGFRFGGGAQTVHALRVDNADPAIAGYRVNPADNRLLTTAEFGARDRDTRAAVNGDFGNYERGRTWGLWKARGRVERSDRGHAFIAAGPRSGAGARVPVYWYRQGHAPLADEDTPGEVAISGFPEILRDGEVTAPAECPGYLDLCSGSHPRTATGVSADRRFTYLVVVEGRMQGAAGMTVRELGRLMKHKVCADSAINHDGGGSSTMWIRGRGVVNRCSDGGGAGGGAGCRRLINHLGVQERR